MRQDSRANPNQIIITEEEQGGRRVVARDIGEDASGVTAGQMTWSSVSSSHSAPSCKPNDKEAHGRRAWRFRHPILDPASSMSSAIRRCSQIRKIEGGRFSDYTARRSLRGTDNERGPRWTID